MPDEEMVEDSVTEDAQDQEQTGQDGSEESGSPSTTEQDGNELAAAEKRIHDLQKGFTEAKEEAKRVREQMESLKSQADQAGAIRELVETLKPKEQAPDWNAYTAQLTEKYGEDQAAIVSEVLTTVNTWHESDRNRLAESFNSELSEVKSALQAERDARVKLSSAYQDNQDTIDELVQGGMKLDKAVEFAAKINATRKPESSSRVSPPADIGSGHVSPQQKEIPVLYTEEDRAEMLADGFTAEEIDERNEQWQREKGYIT